MWTSIIAICIGSSLGALLRWWLGTRLNSLFPAIPPGTLAANLIGEKVENVVSPPQKPVTTSSRHCGGLTTFSTFSAEVVTLLRQGRAGSACGAAAIHLLGSVIMTLVGIGTVAFGRALGQ